MPSRRLLSLLGGGLVAVMIAAACLGGEEGPGEVAPTPSPTAEPQEERDSERDAPVFDVASSWQTNWAKRSISLFDLQVGIRVDNPRDRIPPIDNPQFETVQEASNWLVDREPVMLLELNDDVRAYPLQILTWHEIVNGVVGGVPVVITFCPLCNSAIVFESTVSGEVLRFGTSGLLMNSDLIMWDSKTESLWAQISGEAVVGDMTGTRLKFLPASVIPFSQFKANFPQGRVLSRQTGFARSYGSNPYEYYTSSPRPFLYRGEIDDRFPAMERVVGVVINGQDKAYPFSVIAREGAVNDEVAGVPIVVFWGASDTADALDAPSIAEGQAVGAGLAYERRVDGQVLTFVPLGDDTYRDKETGTVWNILGMAMEGPLAGTELKPVIHANHLWFSWAAFNPDDPVYTGSGG